MHIDCGYLIKNKERHQLQDIRAPPLFVLHSWSQPSYKVEAQLNSIDWMVRGNPLSDITQLKDKSKGYDVKLSAIFYLELQQKPFWETVEFLLSFHFHLVACYIYQKNNYSLIEHVQLFEKETKD